MKKFLSLIACILLVTGFTMQAQTSSEAMNRAIEKVIPLDKIYKEAYGAKDYHVSLQAINSMLECLKNVKLSQEETEQYGEMLRSNIASTYYEQACSYSLLNNHNESIKAIEKAIEYGYKNYNWMMSDKDLENVRNDKKFQKVTEPLKQYDHRNILAASASYRHEDTDTLPRFTYQAEDNHYLKYTRKFFKLDSVAGTGDEVSKIINILNYVHNAIRHDGGNFGVCESDAIDIYNYYKTTGNGVNCRQLAIALNGMYLAMGFPSRYVTCLPKNPDDPDCHVICCVYSSQLDKWLWMDPTFNAYVKDEKGNLLSIEEVRKRIIDKMPLALNDDANWNNESKQTKDYYLDNYMAKNLYWLKCVDYSCFNPEPRFRHVERKYLSLVPQGFTSKATKGANNRLTSDPDYFWQKPK